LHDGHFTHVLMMVLADIQDETYYVPGTTSMTYYGGYYGYYGLALLCIPPRDIIPQIKSILLKPLCIRSTRMN
jgi:hypothetical protein